jgi:hypothetical protein
VASAAHSHSITHWPAEGLPLLAAVEYLAGTDFALLEGSRVWFERKSERLLTKAEDLPFAEAQPLFQQEQQEFRLLKEMWLRCVSHLETAWREGRIIITGRCGDRYAERVEILRTRGVEFDWHGGAVCDQGAVTIFDLRVLPAEEWTRLQSTAAEAERQRVEREAAQKNAAEERARKEAEARAERQRLASEAVAEAERQRLEREAALQRETEEVAHTAALPLEGQSGADAGVVAAAHPVSTRKRKRKRKKAEAAIIAAARRFQKERSKVRKDFKTNEAYYTAIQKFAGIDSDNPPSGWSKQNMASVLRAAGLLT